MKLIVFFAALVLFPCCVQKNGEKIEKEGSKSSNREKVLFIPFTMPVGKLYPVTAEFVTSVEFCTILYEPLVANGLYGNFRPRIAKNWEFSKDRKEITFILRENVRFHNGHQLTSRDVVRSLVNAINNKNYREMKPFFRLKGKNRVLSNGSIRADGIEIVDDYTIKFLLPEPDTNFIRYLTDYRLLISLYDEKNRHIENIGAGPFKLESLTERKVVLTRYRQFFLKEPPIAKLVYIAREDFKPVKYFSEKFVPGYQIKHLPEKQREEIRKLSYVKEIQVPVPMIGFFYLNNSKPPFNDIRIRKAFSLAFNRGDFIDKFYPESFEAKQFIPKGMEGFNNRIYYEINLKKAGELLALANYRSEQLVLVRPEIKPVVKLLNKQNEFINNEFKKAGLNVLLKNIPTRKYLNNTNLKKYHGALMGITSIWSNSAFFLLMRRSTGFLNELYKYDSLTKDKLIDEIVRGSDAAINLDEKYDRIEKIFREEYSIIPVVNKVERLLVNTKVKNFPHRLFTFSAHSFEDVDIEE